MVFKMDLMWHILAIGRLCHTTGFVVEDPEWVYIVIRHVTSSHVFVVCFDKSPAAMAGLTVQALGHILGSLDPKFMDCLWYTQWTWALEGDYFFPLPFAFLPFPVPRLVLFKKFLPSCNEYKMDWKSSLGYLITWLVL